MKQFGLCSSYDVTENTKNEKLDTGEQEKKVQVDWSHHVEKWLRSVSYSHVPAEVDEYWSTEAWIIFK